MQPTTELSPRQHQIAHLVSQGCPDKEIAGRLGIRLSTVKVHLRRVYRVLDISPLCNRRVALAVRLTRA